MQTRIKQISLVLKLCVKECGWWKLDEHVKNKLTDVKMGHMKPLVLREFCYFIFAMVGSPDSVRNEAQRSGRNCRGNSGEGARWVRVFWSKLNCNTLGKNRLTHLKVW